MSPESNKFSRLITDGTSSELKLEFSRILAACIASINSSTPRSDLVRLTIYLDILSGEQANRLAVQMRKYGAQDLACEVYEQLIKRPSMAEAAHLLEALVTFKRAGQSDKIADLLKASEKLLGNSVSGRIARAQLHSSANDFATTRDLLEGLEAAERDGSLDSDSYVRLADMALKIGAVDRAAWLMSKCNPDNTKKSLSRNATIANISGSLGTNPESLAQAYEKGGYHARVYAPEVFFDRAIAAAEPKPDAAPTGGVLFLVNSFAVGGSERNAISMANALSANDKFSWVKIAVVDSNVANPVFKDLLRSTVEIVAVDQKSESAEAISLPPALRSAIESITPTASSAVIMKMIAVFQKLKPEIVHAYAADVRSIQTAMACVACGIPVIMNPGGFTPLGRGRGEEYQVNMRWMRAAYHSLLKHHLVHMMNPSLAASAEYARWIGVPEDCFSVNYYGIDVDAFRPDLARVKDLRSKHGLSESDFVVGGVFRFEEVKRPLLWLETAALVAESRKDARFVLVGDGELLPACKEYAKRLGIHERTIFAGRQLEPVNWYALLSAYLQTSASEGLGNVMIEAAASGVPVVVPPIGGMPETLVHGRTGWIALDDKPASLARAVLSIAEDLSWREQASDLARMFVRARFDIGQMVANSIRMFEMLTSKAKVVVFHQNNRAE